MGTNYHTKNPPRGAARTDIEHAVALYPALSYQYLHELRLRFGEHRGRAKRMGIEFYLTFAQWLKIWVDSSHLADRGCHEGSYVMGRIGDKGAYEVGNVEITTHAANIGLGNQLRPRTGPRPNQSIAMLGRPKSAKHREKLRQAALRRWARERT